jgi:hypothetical protein
MRKLMLLLLTLAAAGVKGQVAVNVTGTPADPSAMLDITYPNGSPKGVLVPRMFKSSRQQIQNPATGLLVYQFDDTTGFYYYDNINGWQALAPARNAWGVNGNAGILSYNFVGTVDEAPLRFGQNNIPSGVINGNKMQTILGYNTNGISFGEMLTALGTGALKSAGGIESCIAIGVGTLGTVIGQGGNIAIGDSSMYAFVNAGVSFSDNTVVGRYAFKTATTGTYNTLVGGQVMEFASGKRNTLIGEGAMGTGSGGDENVGIGRLSLQKNSGGNKNVFVGTETGRENTTGSYNVGIGNLALHKSTTNSRMVAIGDSALAAYNNLASQFPANTAIGYRSMANIVDGISNTAVGYQALFSSNADSRYNVAIGMNAMGNSVVNDFNIAIGYQAMMTASGSQNVAIGANAMSAATGGDYNIAIGYRALINNTGISNTAVGTNALNNNSSGTYNAAFGLNALGANSIGIHNTAVGSGAGSAINAGNKNTFLGYDADASFAGLEMATAIGYSARVSADSMIAFGNGAVKAFLFGRASPSLTTIALQVGLPAGRGNAAYLTSGGVWTNTSDVNTKEDFSSLDQTELLQKITELPVTRWRYKGTNEYHIGPTAQDFHQLFNTGLDDKTISTVDPSGIALAAIKALIKQNENLQLQLDELKKQLLK